MPLSWRVITDSAGSPAYNMAADEAILEAVITGQALPTIRFYGWEPGTLSIGYNQKAEKEADFDLLAQHEFGFVRRPTGGRAVLHHKELTYAVIAPETERFAGGVNAAYAQISLALAKGFELCGMPVEFEKGSLDAASQRQAANPCFASTSRYELHYNKKKICGSAQLRRSGALLQHGSILLDQNQELLAQLQPGLGDEQRHRVKAILAARTTCINANINQGLTLLQAADCFAQGFALSWTMDFFAPGSLDQSEKERCAWLVQNRYSTPAWNLHRQGFSG